MDSGKGSCTVCGGLMRLCGGLDFFPSDVEIRRLLIERLHRLAKNHDHAKAMIERWLETQTAAPKVADLATLANQICDKSNLPRPCPLCAYSGGTWGPVIERGGLSGVGRCMCARGQALAAKDRERDPDPVASQYAARRARSMTSAGEVLSGEAGHPA